MWVSRPHGVCLGIRWHAAVQASGSQGQCERDGDAPARTHRGVLLQRYHHLHGRASTVAKHSPSDSESSNALRRGSFHLCNTRFAPAVAVIVIHPVLRFIVIHTVAVHAETNGLVVLVANKRDASQAAAAVLILVKGISASEPRAVAKAACVKALCCCRLCQPIGACTCETQRCSSRVQDDFFCWCVGCALSPAAHVSKGSR